MQNLSITEENYLKAIYTAMQSGDQTVSTTKISKAMDIAPASVSDMLKKLRDKGLISYQKYYGAELSEQGYAIAGQLVRRHRLWEVFLVEHLHYGWDQVHDVAEQLEHIHSEDLVDRLDNFLGYPEYDPHGARIPDKHGKITPVRTEALTDLAVGQKGKLVRVTDDSKLYLQTLNALQIKLGSIIECLEILEYDNSLSVRIDQKTEHILSEKITTHLQISRL